MLCQLDIYYVYTCLVGLFRFLFLFLSQQASKISESTCPVEVQISNATGYISHKLTKSLSFSRNETALSSPKKEGTKPSIQI